MICMLLMLRGVLDCVVCVCIRYHLIRIVLLLCLRDEAVICCVCVCDRFGVVLCDMRALALVVVCDDSMRVVAMCGVLFCVVRYVVMIE